MPVRKSNLLLPVGGQDPLGLVVPGQPVDPALDEDQPELGVLILRTNKAETLQDACPRFNGTEQQCWTL